MESTDIDIIKPEIKNIFELLFRKNVFVVILFVILANGYSNIAGVSELLTDIFSSHLLRTLITFILFFQIIDNIENSIIYTIIITSILYLIEYNYKLKNNYKLNAKK
jgi:hypothetical protein